MSTKRSADIVPIEVLRKTIGMTTESVGRHRRARGTKVMPERERARVQAALGQAMSDLEATAQRPGVMFTCQNRTASLLQSYCAQTAMEKDMVTQLKNGALEAVFDDKDPHYELDTVIAKIRYPRRFSWIEPPGRPEKILPETFRLALFGDWGTGLYGAPHVKAAIESDPAQIDLIIHLGDTYYAGVPHEVEDRLMGFWPTRRDAISRSLNGNHEMYAGGRAYIKAVAAFEQRSSCFWFQNDDWVLAGIDTSYHNSLPTDFDLRDDEVFWLSRVIANAGDRKILLFSHHYLFSAFEKAFSGRKLRETMRNFGPQIFAWYWGHEHRCTFYEASDEWGILGRCIGHGGFPYFRDGSIAPPKKPQFIKTAAAHGAPASLVLDGINPFVEGYETEYGPHGYVMLEFQGRTMTERVLDIPNRAEIWCNELKPVRR